MMQSDYNSKLNQLKTAIATMNSKLLNQFVLYGTFDSIINSLSKDERISQIQYLLQLSKNWNRGNTLLKEAFSKLNIGNIDNDIKSNEEYDAIAKTYTPEKTDKTDTTEKKELEETSANATDAADVKNFTFVNLKAPQCDKGHDLVLFTSEELIAESKGYSGGYGCDGGCGGGFQVGSQAYHCSQCGWDSCPQCWKGQKMRLVPDIENEKTVGLQIKIAIERGDETAFKAIIAKLKEMDVKVLRSVVANWKDEDFATTLVTWASLYNKSEMATILVEHGVTLFIFFFF